MKYIIPILLAGLLVACHKDDTLKKIPTPVSINVIHAMPKGKAIVSRFGPDTTLKYYAFGIKVNYGSAQLFAMVSGKTPLRIAQISDTTRALFNNTLNLIGGNVYSLFLAGDTTRPDTLFVRDVIPSYTDSSSGVRFINLALGGKSLKVNVYGDAAHPVTNLSYLQKSDFIKYSAKSNIPGKSYKFEVRDAATGDSLIAYTWAFTPFVNNTILITGSTNSADGTPLKVFSTKNY